MADLRGQQLKDSYQNVVTRGGGNKLENGNGVEFADLDDKASLSAINDDEEFYEQGVHLPELDSGGSPTYGVRVGEWVRIGELIFYNFRIEVTDLGGASGNVFITAPFACGEHTAGTLGRFINIDYTDSIVIRIDEGASNMRLWESISGGDATTSEIGDVSMPFDLQGTITYKRAVS